MSRAVWEAAQTAPTDAARGRVPLSGIARVRDVRPRHGRKPRRERAADLPVLRRRSACTEAKAASGEPSSPPASSKSTSERSPKRLLAGSRHRWRPGRGPADAAERAVNDAEAEVDAFASDMTLPQSAGGPVSPASRIPARGAQEGAEHIPGTGTAGADVADAADPEILDDPQLLSVALRSIFSSIIVMPGRGSVTDRVRLHPIQPGRVGRRIGL